MSTRLRPLSPTQATRSGVELAYLAAFVAAELVGLWDPFAGGVCDGVLVIALINQYVLAERDRRRPLLLALAVVCLYRLLALTPLPANDFTNHLVLVGAPTLMATLLALRALGAPLPSLRVEPRLLAAQALIALSGLPLAYAAYKLLNPGFVVTFSGTGHSAAVAAAVIALIVFSGIGEEVLFRSLVHNAARSTFGASALYVSALVFGAAYIGTRSVPFVLFAVAVGAFFGWCYERTGSVVGVALAHSLISVGVFVVLPSLSR
jgi:membrane protease YdiL (CAAX protease family)